MRIGELSKETGVSQRSLRHYEDKGLLTSKRLMNGYRYFDLSAIEKVKVIQMYLQFGLNLDEIKRLICCIETNPDLYKNPSIGIIEFYEEKLTEIQRKIALLSFTKENLEKCVFSLKQKSKRTGYVS
ncbi:MerR family transcriptional regulator [Bacillus anthracis]|uniref:MerR family transcriptional regulator n=1 Tax=Bacillus cereus TaxID=1396 RepID=A0AAN6B576_BACCE|nr:MULTISPECIES: MerR family transcriptional regulator [Bacillus]PED52310.1 MerR family transcriptional regulator [Bacillus anthracis]KAB2446141.1 MerR family transcriptional regulator [Bacillus cereus]PDY57614.1 MerR family transcriptional regulator [Bacillus thuringiensis]PEF62682.1 MerR family transcriptional regulator [Bacillus anthracis]PEV21380.1 MerR family transcriptional regulator [Bacillus thuringiensis]